jgi:CHAT domain-containing protein
LWAVSKTGVNAWELPPRARIETAARNLLQLVTSRAATPVEAASRELSDLTLAPAASALAGKRLLIVPDGALQQIPFAMLPIPGSPEPLVTAHEIVFLPSASALAVLRNEMKGRQPAPKTLAVFADPVFEATDAAPSPDATRILEHLADTGSGTPAATLKIPRLPFTAVEADQILRVAGGSGNWKATGYQASRAAALSGQLSQYRYLHFATHGVLDSERPSLSALVLSQVDENHKPLDGFLRVNDIYNTRISADLVVLSACQTGLGKDVRGEGLMGLTRAFFYAGAPRVVVSLWNVNDRATADLMTLLYRGILRQGKSPAAALRAAQLELRKQKRWESPYYWAAFVQHGEWK